MKIFIENRHIVVFKKEHNGVCYLERVYDTLRDPFVLYNFFEEKDFVECASNVYQSLFHSGFIWYSSIVADPERERPNFVRSLITGCTHYCMEEG